MTIGNTLPLERSSVLSAHELIKPHIHLTPVLTSTTLSDLASTPQSPEALIGTPFEGQNPAHPRIHFFFKCENYQRIGAFKSRGAFHALSRLSREELSRGVVTHSSGASETFMFRLTAIYPSYLANSCDLDLQAITHKPSLLLHALSESLPISSCPQYPLHLRSQQRKGMGLKSSLAVAHRKSGRPSWKM